MRESHSCILPCIAYFKGLLHFQDGGCKFGAKCHKQHLDSLQGHHIRYSYEERKPKPKPKPKPKQKQKQKASHSDARSPSESESLSDSDDHKSNREFEVFEKIERIALVITDMVNFKYGVRVFKQRIIDQGSFWADKTSEIILDLIEADEITHTTLYFPNSSPKD